MEEGGRCCGGGLPFLVEFGTGTARVAGQFDFGVDAEGGGGAFFGGRGAGRHVGREVGGEGVGEGDGEVVEEGVEVVGAGRGVAAGRGVRRHGLDWEGVVFLAILFVDARDDGGSLRRS